MFRRLATASVLAIACVFTISGAANAAPATSASAYDTFTAGAKAQHGLFTIWHKDGKVYLELLKSQLDTDFMETITTGNGTGQGLFWGDTDYLPAELVRFERRGDQIAIVWPNWYAHTGDNAQAQLATEGSFPDSIVGSGSIAAEDDQHVVFDLASLASDQLDLHSLINDGLPDNQHYDLDSNLTFFDSTKAFPDNDVVTIDQTWETSSSHVIDTAPDARHVEVKVVYNLTQLPQDTYRPRLSDDRVGIYNDIYYDFSSESLKDRKLRYVVRWNFDPADPTRPSVARHPMVIYLSKTIPPQYRGVITEACEIWNKAYEKAGILDAVQVKDQPDDPNWDPDDVRYNVIRWLTEAHPGFGADSQTLFDPRTGEEFRVGVLLEGEQTLWAQQTWRYEVDPARYGRSTDPMPAQFLHDQIFATVVHEMGHNMGLQHNFIGSDAYTAKNLQSLDFTKKYGIATSVMEYAPINLWPRGTPQGTYAQTTIGPYDYYAIKFAYKPIPSANSIEAELPTLKAWASGWSNPLYRYASDEDVQWNEGHAADPRVEQGDLTNDTLGWCNAQIGMYRGVISSLNALEPRGGDAYEDETDGFHDALRQILYCATVPSHWIGGQYLSRAHRGDPGAAPPIVPVSYADEKHAFAMLDANLFADNAWTFPAALLDRLNYSEWAGYGYVSWPGAVQTPLWAYDPPDRHDTPVVDEINRSQSQTLSFFFQPLVLQRIDENPLLATSRTMTIGDLFEWLQNGIYGNLTDTKSTIRRNLQTIYAEKLAALATKPPTGTPSDAPSLARLELQHLHDATTYALGKRGLDPILQAHLGELAAIAATALKP